MSLVAVAAVHEPRGSFAWRGPGESGRLGLRVRNACAASDAERKPGVGCGAPSR